MGRVRGEVRQRRPEEAPYVDAVVHPELVVLDGEERGIEDASTRRDYSSSPNDNVIVDNISWRWIFYVNLPIGAVALALAALWLREERQDTAGALDLRGLVLSATGVSFLIYTLSTGPENGWLAPATIATFDRLRPATERPMMAAMMMPT